MRKIRGYVPSLAAIFTLTADLTGLLLFAGLLRIAYAAGGYLYENSLEPFKLASVWVYLIFVAFIALQIVVHTRLSSEETLVSSLTALFILDADFFTFAVFVGMSKVAEETNGNAGISSLVYVAAIILLAFQIGIWRGLHDRSKG